MKMTWPASLRARLLVLVAVCSAPAVLFATYMAIERYQSATHDAYTFSRLADGDVANRYEHLSSMTHNLLSAISLLPAVASYALGCHRMLAALRAKIPMYGNLTVISIDGDIRCSAVPLTHPISVADRRWFIQVLNTRRFVSAVIQHARVIHQPIILFALLRIGRGRNPNVVITAAVPVKMLRLIGSQASLSNGAEATVFNADGTILMQYPRHSGLVGTNQSHSPLFKAAANPRSIKDQILPGIDGKPRFYVLQKVSTGIPGNVIYVASGIQKALLQRMVFIPMVRDLGLILGVVALIILWIWWLTGAFVAHRVQPLLRTLQRIGNRDWSARTGLAGAGGEIGSIAVGVDRMAEALQWSTLALQAAERAQESSDRRYADLVERAIDGIMVRRPSGELVFVNDAFSKMSGYSRIELLSMNVTELIDKSNPVPVIAQLRPGETSRSEGRMRHKDGSVLSVDLSVACLANGETQLMVHDVSERVRAEMALRQSQQQYHDLIEQAMDGIMLRRPSGELILVNEALCQMLGYSRNELMQMHIQDVADGSALRDFELSIEQKQRVESWMRHKDGHLVPVEVGITRLRNGDIQTTHRDNSELLKALHKIEESERQYRDLVEQAMVGILVRRPTGEIIFANAAFCRITGYSRDELLRMHALNLVDKSETPGFLRVQSLKIGESLSFQSRLLHKIGTMIHVDVSAHRLENGDVQIVANDVSERVSIEQRFAEERNFIFHAIDTMPGIFYVFNAEGRFLRWNRNMEDVTGYSMQELAKIRSSDIVPVERRANHARLVTEILAGMGMEGETELCRKDGTRIPYYYVARSFVWQGQSCVVGVGIDIRDRKDAERKLLDEHTMINHAINSLGSIFYLFSEGGELLLWNHALEQVSGYCNDEVAQMHLLRFIAPEHRDQAVAAIAAVFTEGSASLDANFLCRDGRQIPYHFTGRRLEWQSQTCLVGSGVDMTDRIDAGLRVQIYLEELQQLSARLLARQEEERRHIARELHDEMGQGLTAALLSVKDLTSQLEPGPFASQLTQISAIITDLTQRMRTLSLDLRPSVLDDLGLAAAARWYVRERVESANLHVNLAMDQSFPRLPSIVETTCFRVLQSALTNVQRHARAHRVEVNLHLSNGELSLTIHDDGQGFDVMEARRQSAAGKTFGLVAMDERVRLVGGALR